ncbi:hypothetical protein VTI28DRAFT_179 [Corynascus sepedonium]
MMPLPDPPNCSVGSTVPDVPTDPLGEMEAAFCAVTKGRPKIGGAADCGWLGLVQFREPSQSRQANLVSDNARQRWAQPRCQSGPAPRKLRVLRPATMAFLLPKDSFCGQCGQCGQCLSRNNQLLRSLQDELIRSYPFIRNTTICKRGTLSQEAHYDNAVAIGDSGQWNRIKPKHIRRTVRSRAHGR